MPIDRRRLPKRGFHNLHEQGGRGLERRVRSQDSATARPWTAETLASKKGLIRGRAKIVKLLGEGDAPKNLTVKLHRIERQRSQEDRGRRRPPWRSWLDRRRPEHRKDPGAPAPDPLHVRHARSCTGSAAHIVTPGVEPRGRCGRLRSTACREPSSGCSTCSRAARWSSSPSSRWASCPTSVRLDHHAAPDGRDSRQLEALKKEGEQGQQEDHPVHPLWTIVLALFQGLLICERPRERDSSARGPSSRSGLGLPPDVRDHADLRDRVHHVARGAGHRAWHRQRHLVDHLRGHRHRDSRRDRPDLRADHGTDQFSLLQASDPDRGSSFS